jgi:hypothetical protein
MNKIELSKAEAAKRQLVTAIQLYFGYGDEVSMHTLAAAARNVLADLCEHKGVSSPILLERLLEDLVRPEHHKKVRVRFREPENFFKHADSDPDEVLCFNAERTEFLLLEGVEAYSLLTGEQVPELHAYRGWWLLHNQDCLKGASEEYLRRLNGVAYEAYERRQFFSDMLATLKNAG